LPDGGCLLRVLRGKRAPRRPSGPSGHSTIRGSPGDRKLSQCRLTGCPRPGGRARKRAAPAQQLRGAVGPALAPYAQNQKNDAVRAAPAGTLTTVPGGVAGIDSVWPASPSRQVASSQAVHHPIAALGSSDVTKTCARRSVPVASAVNCAVVLLG